MTLDKKKKTLLGGIGALIALIAIFAIVQKNDGSPWVNISWAGETDSDGDGLSDEEELKIGTNVYDNDSDKDGYLDNEEVKNGHDPLLAEDDSRTDEDEDGLTKMEEEEYGTNPILADSDFDGYNDGEEIANGHDPLTGNLASFEKFTGMEVTGFDTSYIEQNSDEYTELLKKAVETNDPNQFNGYLNTLIGVEEETKLEIIKINDDEIITHDDTSSSAIESYLNTVGVIFTKYVPFKNLNELQEYAQTINPQSSSSLEDIVVSLQRAEQELRSLEVPDTPDIVELHKETLQNILTAKKITQGFTEINYNEGRQIYKASSLMQQTDSFRNYITGEYFQKLNTIASKYNVSLPVEYQNLLE